ncbi:DNA integrity scanning protein DisA nucleotide-binding domain protein [bacterium]|nr:DNA integrity scanning protein DisA nucleotide-binding domain protein [bacterium]
MDVLVLRMQGLDGSSPCWKTLNRALMRDRAYLYGVKTVQFATETPGARTVRSTSNVTLVYLGSSLASAPPELLALALEDLKRIKAESPQYPVVAILDVLSLEDDLLLQKLGFEAVSAAQIPDERSVRAFVENKIIELRLGIAPPLLPESMGLPADDVNVLQSIKYEFAGATPPAELWTATPARVRRNFIITFTYFARACRRLATRVIEGRTSATAFVLTHRASELVRRFARRGATVFRFGKRQLRVSLGGIHQGDMDDISRVSDWPGSFVVLDAHAIIMGVVATPEQILRDHSSSLAGTFAKLLGKRAEVGFLVPGDGTVRVFVGEREVLRHDGFEWRTNNRQAVAAAFERTCSEVAVPPKTASVVFEAAMILAEQKRGCFVILGNRKKAKRIAMQSVPLDPRLSVALEEHAIVGASPLLLSALAVQDGALVVDDRSSVLGFARLVRTRGRPNEAAMHGTKHATAIQLTRERRDICALVVSQDGPASVYLGGEQVARTQF